MVVFSEKMKNWKVAVVVATVAVLSDDVPGRNAGVRLERVEGVRFRRAERGGGRPGLRPGNPDDMGAAAPPAPGGTRADAVAAAQPQRQWGENPFAQISVEYEKNFPNGLPHPEERLRMEVGRGTGSDSHWPAIAGVWDPQVLMWVEQLRREKEKRGVGMSSGVISSSAKDISLSRDREEKADAKAKGSDESDYKAADGKNAPFLFHMLGWAFFNGFNDFYRQKALLGSFSPALLGSAGPRMNEIGMEELRQRAWCISNTFTELKNVFNPANVHSQERDEKCAGIGFLRRESERRVKFLEKYLTDTNIEEVFEHEGGWILVHRNGQYDKNPVDDKVSSADQKTFDERRLSLRSSLTALPKWSLKGWKTIGGLKSPASWMWQKTYKDAGDESQKQVREIPEEDLEEIPDGEPFEIFRNKVAEPEYLEVRKRDADVFQKIAAGIRREFFKSSSWNSSVAEMEYILFEYVADRLRKATRVGTRTEARVFSMSRKASGRRQAQPPRRPAAKAAAGRGSSGSLEAAAPAAEVFRSARPPGRLDEGGLGPADSLVVVEVAPFLIGSEEWQRRARDLHARILVKKEWTIDRMVRAYPDVLLRREREGARAASLPDDADVRALLGTTIKVPDGYVESLPKNWFSMARLQRMSEEDIRAARHRRLTKLWLLKQRYDELRKTVSGELEIFAEFCTGKDMTKFNGKIVDDLPKMNTAQLMQQKHDKYIRAYNPDLDESSKPADLDESRPLLSPRGQEDVVIVDGKIVEEPERKLADGEVSLENLLRTRCRNSDVEAAQRRSIGKDERRARVSIEAQASDHLAESRETEQKRFAGFLDCHNLQHLGCMWNAMGQRQVGAWEDPIRAALATEAKNRRNLRQLQNSLFDELYDLGLLRNTEKEELKKLRLGPKDWSHGDETGDRSRLLKQIWKDMLDRTGFVRLASEEYDGDLLDLEGYDGDMLADVMSDKHREFLEKQFAERSKQIPRMSKEELQSRERAQLLQRSDGANDGKKGHATAAGSAAPDSEKVKLQYLHCKPTDTVGSCKALVAAKDGGFHSSVDAASPGGAPVRVGLRVEFFIKQVEIPVEHEQGRVKSAGVARVVGSRGDKRHHAFNSWMSKFFRAGEGDDDDDDEDYLDDDDEEDEAGLSDRFRRPVANSLWEIVKSTLGHRVLPQGCHPYRDRMAVFFANLAKNQNMKKEEVDKWVFRFSAAANGPKKVFHDSNGYKSDAGDGLHGQLTREVFPSAGGRDDPARTWEISNVFQRQCCTGVVNLESLPLMNDGNAAGSGEIKSRLLLLFGDLVSDMFKNKCSASQQGKEWPGMLSRFKDFSKEFDEVVHLGYVNDNRRYLLWPGK